MSPWIFVVFLTVLNFDVYLHSLGICHYFTRTYSRWYKCSVLVQIYKSTLGNVNNCF